MKKIFDRINNDERINRQIYRFGFEVFVIMTLLLAGWVFVKSFIFDLSFSEFGYEFIVLAIGGIYFIMRCALGGVFSFPSKKNEKKSMIKYIVIGNIIFGLLMGAITAVRNSFIYLDGGFNSLSLAIFVITSISAMVMGFSIIGGFVLFSNYWSNKKIE